MSISELAIRRHVFAWMLMAGLIIFGAISMNRMGVSQMPDVDLPVISIRANMRGAAPSVMEMQVVDQIEDAVMGVQGVRTITSSSRDSSASISVEFELTRDIDVALQEVQTKISQAQRNLPAEMDPVVISKSNPDDSPIMWVAVSSRTTPLRDIMIYVRDFLKDQFTTITDVGDVFLGGYTDPSMRVWVSGLELAERQLTVTDVENAILSEHQEIPAGWIDSGSRESNVRTMGEISDPGELGRIFINTRGGAPNYRPVMLSSVARVEEGLADIRRLSRARGHTAVGLGVLKQKGSNAVQVARSVRAKVEKLKELLPKDVEISIVNDQTRFIEDSVRDLKFTLLLAVILTGLVCWLFLGSWSSTLNVFLAIPTSVVGSFIILYFSGFTLNSFTLLGLSLSIGIVVDDAIMVLENIIRHQELGEDKVQAAIKGTKQVTFAAMATTVSIVAIFLPVAFMSGIIGKFFFQFGITISAAVLLSLVEALTLTPMRCSQFVDVGKRRGWLGRHADAAFKAVAVRYRRALAWVLDRPRKFVGSALGVAVLLLLAAIPLNKEFIPSQDMSMFGITMRAPVGSSLDYTDSKARQMESILSGRPEVSNVFATVGGFGGNDPTQAMVMLSLKPKGQRGTDREARHELNQSEVMALYRKLLRVVSGVKVFIRDFSQSGFGLSHGYPIECTLQGPDWEKLGQLSGALMKEMDKSGLMVDIDSSYRVGMPELQVIPDRERAKARGVSVATIGVAIGVAIGGDRVAQYTKGGHRYDILVQLEPSERENADAIRKLLVRNNRGELIPLPEVVNIDEKSTLQQITRTDRQRSVTVTANVKPGASQQAALDAVKAAADKLLPSEYRIVTSGSSKSFGESFRNLALALGLGILIAYMVLASQFNSFIDPITVLMALPFSVSGAFLALLITRQSLNIYSFIGLILLMGLVKKNSIMLVDFTNQVRDRAGRRHTVREGLMEACPIRLRPILMTSCATIAGALPAALAFGPGAETRIPMAVTVIGGIIVSTGLTLFVVPCVYSLFSRLDRRWAR